MSTTQSPPRFSRPADCVDALLERVGKTLVVGTPLGLGKANYLLNELFRRACDDPSIDLTIVTALTLEPPVPASDLEARFLKPIVARLFDGYPPLAYARALRHAELPPNVRVHEFFLTPGQWLAVEQAQQNYISSNYTHVARDMLARGANVIMQMVSPGGEATPGRLSLACNPDVTLDLVPAMRGRGTPCAVVGEINASLPFMFGDAVVAEDYFDFLCEPDADGYTLFGTPKGPVGDADHAIGLYASALVKDGGTLQVGIGGMGDAVVYGLGLRHQQPALYRELLTTACDEMTLAMIADWGGLERFEAGLYGASEMLVDGFLYLFDLGILKRRVYDDVALQRLINENRIGHRPDARMLLALRDAGAISSRLTDDDVAYLKTWGILRDEVAQDSDALILPDGQRVTADLDDDETLARLADGALGERLAGASVAHGGFFLGPQAFYAALREMPAERRELLKMTSVARINQLYGGEALDRAQRAHARFINSCMMVTLTGAVVSDGLADGRVVSGVGGQYNFVAMAHALDGGRSIIKLRSTRTSKGRPQSNIVFDYAHTTIPRHLRDIVVTEYGIADLRSRSDAECVAALLNVADSRFQQALMARAKAAGKLPRDHVIAPRFSQNTPERVAKLLTPRDQFPPFPFGTDMTDDELVLGRALRRLKAATASTPGLIATLARALAATPRDPATARLLTRLDLDAPKNLRERVYRRLVAWAL